MWKDSVPLAAPGSGHRCVQLSVTRGTMPIRAREGGWREKEKELVELQQNGNEIEPSCPHETQEKWKQLHLGWAGITAGTFGWLSAGTARLDQPAGETEREGEAAWHFSGGEGNKKGSQKGPKSIELRVKILLQGKQAMNLILPTAKNGASASELYRPTEIMSTGKREPANGADSRDLTVVEKTILKGSCFVLSTCPGKEK